MKTKIGFGILVTMLTFLPAAQAGTKEELIRLQSEIMSLQKQLLEFDKSYNERIDGLRSLIVQLTDEVAKSSNTMTRLGAAIDSRTEDARTMDKALRTELEGMGIKIEDAAVSISAMAQQLNEMKAQTESMAAEASGFAPDTMYNQAYNDFVMGNDDMAIEGFTIYIDTYPTSGKAANALLYLGDSYSRQNKLKPAMDSFSRVITEYPQAAVVPSALFKRARVELALQEKDNAIADYRDIIDRFPSSSEADQARAELQQLGVLRPTAAPKAKTPARRTAR